MAWPKERAGEFGRRSALAARRAATGGSWWVDRSREEFSAEAKRQYDSRMVVSNTGRRKLFPGEIAGGAYR